MTIGQSIKNARLNAGLTQKQLAEKSGIATITLQQYERDVREPKLDTIAKIARALGLFANDLIKDQWKNVDMNPNHDTEVSVHENDSHQLLTRAFRKLNPEGQQKAVERVQELTEIPRYRATEQPQEAADASGDKEPDGE